MQSFRRGFCRVLVSTSIIESGIDVVHTKRAKRLGESKFKILLTKIAYLTINIISDIPLAIDVGDFKLLSRRAVNNIASLKEYDTYILC